MITTDTHIWTQDVEWWHGLQNGEGAKISRKKRQATEKDSVQSLRSFQAETKKEKTLYSVDCKTELTNPQYTPSR